MWSHYVCSSILANYWFVYIFLTCIYTGDTFTIEIYHGGEFRSSLDKIYVRGKVNHYDQCEPDSTSMLEINDVVI